MTALTATAITANAFIFISYLRVPLKAWTLCLG